MTVSSLEHDIPQIVLDAALALHKRKNTDLTYSLSSTAEVTIVGNDPLWRSGNGEVVFAHLEARNRCVALATLQQLIPLKGTDALFDAAYKLLRNESGHSDSASGRLLGLASQKVSVLLEAANAIRDKSRDVFNLLRLLGKALPHLQNIRADDIVTIIDAQHNATKGDMASGIIFNAIEDRLRSESQLAWEIWRITSTNMSESMQNLYSTALQALMHTDQQALALEKARNNAEDIDPLIAGAALWSLGRAIQTHKLDDCDLDDCVAVLISKTCVVTTAIQQAAVRAVAHASMKDARLMSELIRLAAKQGDYTLAVVTDFLFLNQEDLPAHFSNFTLLLQSLIGLLPLQNDAIGKFDWILHQLYASPENRPLVLACLTQWIIKHGNSSLNDKTMIELFDQTIMQIVNDHPGFQAVITHWLIAPEIQLAVACGGLISYLNIRGMKSPAFAPEVLNTFTSQDFKFLARRLLGYVISEEPLLSLTLSLLQTNNAPERSFGWVFTLLTEHVGRDYAQGTMQALKVQLQTANALEKEMLVKICEILIQRSTASGGLPRLQELRPPMRLQRAITLNRAREMQQTVDSAGEDSFANAFFSKIPLKAGIGWFSVSKLGVEPTHHLQTISHSVSLPTRALTDPVGYAITGLLNRIAKRDDE